MQKKLGIAYQSHPARPDPERQLRYAVSAGFSETELSFGGALTEELFRACRTTGVLVGAIRLPREGANRIWQAPEEGTDDLYEILHEIYSSAISFAARAGISAVILFPSVGMTPPPVSQCGIDRLRELAALASARGVRLAVENTESEAHFEAAVRAVCDGGEHGVSFRPELADRYFGSSAVPTYALPYLCRVALADLRGEVADALPFDGTCHYTPFILSMVDRRYDVPFVLAADATTAPYSEMDYPTYAARAYDALCLLVRKITDAEDAQA